MPKKRSDHTRIAGTDGDHIRLYDDGTRKTFRCERCGVEVSHTLPIPLDDWVALSKLFLWQHKKCKPTQKGVK